MSRRSFSSLALLVEKFGRKSEASCNKAPCTSATGFNVAVVQSGLPLRVDLNVEKYHNIAQDNSARVMAALIGNSLKGWPKAP